MRPDYLVLSLSQSAADLSTQWTEKNVKVLFILWRHQRIKKSWRYWIGLKRLRTQEDRLFRLKDSAGEGLFILCVLY